MEYTITSFLKTSTGFIRGDDCATSPADKDYVEGAIAWRIGTREIFSVEHWDLVDQLWAYIVDGMVHVAGNQDFETYFPDQPLLLRFRRISPTAVEVSIGERATLVPAEDFFRMLAEGGRHFFTEMIRLVPEERLTWDKLISKLDAISPMS